MQSNANIVSRFIMSRIHIHVVIIITPRPRWWRASAAAIIILSFIDRIRSCKEVIEPCVGGVRRVRCSCDKWSKKFWVKRKKKALNLLTWTFQRATRTTSSAWPTSVRRRQPFMHRPIQPRSWSSEYSSRSSSLSTTFISFQQTPKKIICSTILPTMWSSSTSRRLYGEEREEREGIVGDDDDAIGLLLSVAERYFVYQMKNIHEAWLHALVESLLKDKNRPI